MSIELLTAIILNITVRYCPHSAESGQRMHTDLQSNGVRSGNNAAWQRKSGVGNALISVSLNVGDQMRKYERLRNLREDFDMTQSEVGAYLHISQRSYAHYEAGTRDIPLEILIELANLYQVNLDYLVGRTNVKDLLP